MLLIVLHKTSIACFNSFVGSFLKK